MTGEKLLIAYKALVIDLNAEDLPIQLINRVNRFEVELEETLRAEEVIDVA